MPVRCEPLGVSVATNHAFTVLEAREPGNRQDGLGWAHFIDCPTANRYRKPA